MYIVCGETAALRSEAKFNTVDISIKERMNPFLHPLQRT
jgi:hypothetical protein